MYYLTAHGKRQVGATRKLLWVLKRVFINNEMLIFLSTLLKTFLSLCPLRSVILVLNG